MPTIAPSTRLLRRLPWIPKRLRTYRPSEAVTTSRHEIARGVTPFLSFGDFLFPSCAPHFPGTYCSSLTELSILIDPSEIISRKSFHVRRTSLWWCTLCFNRKRGKRWWKSVLNFSKTVVAGFLCDDFEWYQWWFKCVRVCLSRWSSNNLINVSWCNVCVTRNVTVFLIEKVGSTNAESTLLIWIANFIFLMVLKCETRAFQSYLPSVCFLHKCNMRNRKALNCNCILQKKVLPNYYYYFIYLFVNFFSGERNYLRN